MKYWKRIAAALLLSSSVLAVSIAETRNSDDANTIHATPTTQTIYFDGAPCALSGYTIENANYFLLSDIARLLRSTKARFSFAVDTETQTISLTTGGKYEPEETPTTPNETVSETAPKVVPAEWRLTLDGMEVPAVCYSVDGEIFYGLRDLSQCFGFEVAFDGEANRINIIAPYDPVVPESDPVDPSWFDDAVFIGDSVSSWLNFYGGDLGLGQATFLTATSFGIENALSPVTSSSLHPSYQGEKMKVEDVVARAGAKKVYIMFGLNDIDYGVEYATNDYVRLIQQILEKSPDVQIYVESVTPVLRDSRRADESFNNVTIQQFNDTMKAHCEANRWNYMDIASVYKDADGALRPEVCNDPQTMGLHITFEATSEWVQYLRTHTR